MEKSQLSEEQIIKLGKRIVEELNFKESVNTLGRWMSHYLAELIEKAEKCEDEEEKKSIQNECTTLILQLWEKKEIVPKLSTPLDDLEYLVEILRIFNQEKNDLPFWKSFSLQNRNTGIGNLIETVKTNSESIFRIGLLFEANKELIDKKKEWIEKHSDLLSKEEKEFIILFNNHSKSHSIKDFKSFDTEDIKLFDLENHERYKLIFDLIENEIKEMLEELEKLRKTKVIAKK